MYLYQKMYDDLLLKIREGQYANGKLLPTERELMQRYSVSRITAKKVFELLLRDGLIARTPGKGTALVPQQPVKKERDKKLIGTIFCDIGAAFGQQILLGQEAQAAQLGYKLLFQRSMDMPEKEDRLIQELLEYGVSGILVQNCHGDYSKSLLRLYCDDFPVVSIDRGTQRIPIPCVTSDHHAAAVTAAEHLFSLGHRNILYLSCAVEGTTTLSDRLEGFHQAYANRRLQPDGCRFLLNMQSPVSPQESAVEADLISIHGALQENPGITAVFATERFLASLAQRAVSAMDKKIPADYSLICFDYEETFRDVPLLTHLAQNQYQIGVESVKLLDRMIAGEAVETKVILPAKLVQGQSTAGVFL